MVSISAHAKEKHDLTEKWPQEEIQVSDTHRKTPEKEGKKEGELWTPTGD